MPNKRPTKPGKPAAEPESDAGMAIPATKIRIRNASALICRRPNGLRTDLDIGAGSFELYSNRGFWWSDNNKPHDAICRLPVTEMLHVTEFKILGPNDFRSGCAAVEISRLKQNAP